MSRAFFIPLLLIAAAAAHSQTKPIFKLNVRPSVKGPVRLSAAQLQSWRNLMNVTKPKAAGTLIYVPGNQLTHSFPDGLFRKTIFCAPVKQIEFFVRAEGYPTSVTTFEVQISKEPTSISSVPPYTGWNKPKGFLHSYRVKVPMASGKGGTTEGPLSPVNDFGFVKLSPDALTGQVSLYLPFALSNTTGSNFYVRFVPVRVKGNVSEPIGPPSNWEGFIVSVREDDYLKMVADKEAAAAAAQAKAEAAKKAKELQAAIESARTAIRNAYEIRVLSYVPPKFADDPGAQDYFVANRKVNLTYGSKATQLVPGETYSLSAMHNVLNSNKPWTQEMWDLASAELNLVSSGYNAAKSFAVETLADGIELIPGVNIGPAGRAALMTVLNMALTYCGIPPEIPNIDQLYNRGLDYLAATVADMALEQVTGVAIEDFGANPDVVMGAQKQARDAAAQSMRSMFKKFTEPTPFVADSPETWGYPAPIFRRHPAMLYIEIRKKAGAAGVAGQSWQNLQLGFSREFYNISTVLLPRTMNQKVRIPIALATVDGPEGWNVVGMMPEKSLDPEAGVGQPYYGNRGSASLFFTTYHRLSGTGTVFPVFWPKETLETGYVNGRVIPNGFQKPDTEIEGPIVLGPSNYFGHTKVSFFEP